MPPTQLLVCATHSAADPPPPPFQGKQRDAYMREQQRLAEFSNQVELIKSTLSKAAADLSQRTAENAGARDALDDKRWVRDAGGGGGGSWGAG